MDDPRILNQLGFCLATLAFAAGFFGPQKRGFDSCARAFDVITLSRETSAVISGCPWVMIPLMVASLLFVSVYAGTCAKGQQDGVLQLCLDRARAGHVGRNVTSASSAPSLSLSSSVL